MKRLFHWPLDPHARMVRLALGEKALAADLIETARWTTNTDLARLAPGATIPALVDDGADGRTVAIGTHAICEHLEETTRDTRLLPIGRDDRAEARRIWRWCEDRLGEVNATLLNERVKQWVRRGEAPEGAALRAGAHALRGHLTFLNALAEARPYLAGRTLSLADLSAAAHLSAYDYFGDVDWDGAPDVKAWYARLKSRPSFRQLLADRIDGARPVPHYADLDF